MTGKKRRWLNPTRGLLKLTERVIDRVASRYIYPHQHFGLWEESHAPPDGGFPKLEITFDPSYSQII